MLVVDKSRAMLVLVERETHSAHRLTPSLFLAVYVSVPVVGLKGREIWLSCQSCGPQMNGRLRINMVVILAPVVVCTRMV